MKSSYPSDLIDEEWKIIAPMLPPAKPGGIPRTTDMRKVCDRIYYHLKTGCQWEYLPQNFPPASSLAQVRKRKGNDNHISLYKCRAVSF
jgi:putative transposase